jgi:tetratricopeptide (TPR) repeat protein
MARSVVSVLLLAAAIAAPLRAATGQTPSRQADPAAAAGLRTRAIDLLYNLDHRDALSALEEAIAADPGDPTTHRLAASTAWITMLFEQGAISADDFLGQARTSVERPAPPPALDAIFRNGLARAMTLSEQRLRARPDDPDAHFQVGATYGYLASYTATIEGRVLGSFGAARRAFREHERVLALDPERKDAALIVGLYRYAVSNLSAPMRLMARLAGFGGDRARAVRLVEAASRYPSDAQPDALLTLVLIYNREERYDDALRVISELKQRFPRNRLMWLATANTSLKAGRPADAKAAIEEGRRRYSQDTRPRALGEESRWHYVYGAALAALKDDVPAERELRAAVRLASRDWVRGRAHAQLGRIADRAGDRPRAREEYRTAERLCRADHDDDCADDAKRLGR